MRVAPNRKEYVRAARHGEKLERRAKILDGARAVLRAHGFEKFTLDRVAQEVGLSRGGMYSYFRTREDLLLALHVEVVAEFTKRLRTNLKPGSTDEEFVKDFVDAAYADDLFLPIITRYDRIVTDNTSEDAFAEWRRQYVADSRITTSFVADLLNLDRRRASEAIWAMTALLMGASQMRPRRAGGQDAKISADAAVRFAAHLNNTTYKACITLLKGLRNN